MFKHVLALVALLSCSFAFAQIVPSATVAEAQAQAIEKCTEGCVILSPADMASIEAYVQEAVQQAYQAGLRGWSKATNQ